MAIRVFGDASRRPEAKALGHAANYGMGPRSFADHAGISVVEARSQLDRLHREFPELESFKEHLRKSAKTRGWVSTGFGRRVAVARDAKHRLRTVKAQRVTCSWRAFSTSQRRC